MTETRLKREAQAQGLHFSDFLRERLTGEKQKIHEAGMEEFAKVMDSDLRQICDFLGHMEREQSENAYLLQLMMCHFMLLLMPNGKEKIQNMWHSKVFLTRER